MIKEKEYSCTNPDCPKTFKTPEDRDVHAFNACGIPPQFKCGYCRYSSYLVLNIKRHIADQHPDAEMKIIKLSDSVDESNFYPCPNDNCGKIYKRSVYLRVHLRNECGKSPKYKCGYCDFKHCLKKRVTWHNKKKHQDKEPYVMQIKYNLL